METNKFYALLSKKQIIDCLNNKAISDEYITVKSVNFDDETFMKKYPNKYLCLFTSKNKNRDISQSKLLTIYDRKYLKEIDSDSLMDYLNGKYVVENLTNNQKGFFKNSKIRDKQGNLQVCYHGSNKKGIKEFNPKGNQAQFGTDFGNYTVNFFTTDIDNASSYGSNIYSVYLNIKNPLIIDVKGKSWLDIEREGSKENKLSLLDKFYNTWAKTKHPDYLNSDSKIVKQFKEDLLDIGYKLVYNKEHKSFDLYGVSGGVGSAYPEGYCLDTIDDVIDYGFSDGELIKPEEDNIRTGESTNDVVRDVLKNHPEYDGIIFKNIRDSKDMFGSPSDTIVTLKSPQQIKVIDDQTSNKIIKEQLLLEGTDYVGQAIKILDDANLFSHEINTNIINALYKGDDNTEPDIHAFVHSPNWLIKYLKGIARMLVKHANGNKDSAVAFLDEAPAVFEPLLTWIKEHRNEKNAKELDDNFVNKYSFEEAKSFLQEIQDEYEKDSKEKLKNLDTEKQTDYELIRINSFEEMKKFGVGVTGNLKDTSSWCYANGKTTYDSWLDNGKFIMFVLAKKGFEKLEAKAGQNTPKDEYGLSLIGIRVRIDGVRLSNATLRWNHVGVPTNADNQFKSFGELSEVVGFNVEEKVEKLVKEEKDKLEKKIQNLPDYYYKKALKLTTINIDFIKEEHKHLIKSLIIPNNITDISRNAFAFCSSLTSINIPNSVTTIGDGAFYNCSSLTSIVIPNSVTTIGDWAFYYCSSLTSIVIPNSVTTIGDGAFYYCSSLTSIVIPNSVTFIGDYAFYNCSSLTSIVIPNSVTTIGDGAFYSTSLTSIVIPNSVTTIGDWAFYNCSSLTSIVIPDSVTSIGGTAFSGCSILTSITIPNSVTSIGGSAFSYCKNLTIKIEQPHKLNKESIINLKELKQNGHIKGIDWGGQEPVVEKMDKKLVVPKKLYHATFKPLLKSIKEKGLGNTKRKWWDMSERGVVYLAEDPYVAESYAETIDANNFNDEWLDKIIILEIDTTKLDINNFIIDPNNQEEDTFAYKGIISQDCFKLFNNKNINESNITEGFSRNWKPSKTQAKEFASKMNEIEDFCSQNNISQSSRGDSYYFTINGQKYRVSNHAVETSPYHNGREDNTIYIHAGKTRIIEIYNDLKAGKKLDGKGYVIRESLNLNEDLDYDGAEQELEIFNATFEKHCKIINTIPVGSAWILPNGRFLSVTEDDGRFGHPQFLENYANLKPPNNILGNLIKDSIRINNGKNKFDRVYPYIVLTPTLFNEAQENTLLKWMDNIWYTERDWFLVHAPINETYAYKVSDYKGYNIKENLPDDVVKKMKRYYSSGIFVESKRKFFKLKESQEVLETDAEGNQLSKEQSGYFSASEVRDGGKLIPLYHGSKRGFDKFNSQINWFTRNKNYANSFADVKTTDENKRLIYKVYLNCLSIFDAGNTDDNCYNLIPITAPWKYSPACQYLVDSLKYVNVSDKEIAELFEDTDYKTKIFSIVRSPKFINLLKKRFDCIKTLEYGNECYGVIGDANKIKLTTNKIPTSNQNINEEHNTDTEETKFIELVKKLNKDNEDEYDITIPSNISYSVAKKHINKLPDVLYHATTLNNYDNIKKEKTLKPGQPKQWGSSNSSAIYLSVNKDTAEEYVNRSSEDAVIIIKIPLTTLDQSLLFLDPNEEYSFIDGKLNVFNFEYRGEIKLESKESIKI